MSTQPPQLKAIAAMARNRVIGRGGIIPWRISDELRWFKRATTGHTVLMGRKTYQSLGRPLPNRRNLVITRGPQIEGVETLGDLENFDPAHYAAPGTDIYVIGGAEIYAQLLPRCAELLLTQLPGEVEGDATFPPFETLFDYRETVLTHPEFEVRRYVRKAAK
ncbi:MAG: dihydrofolate reductase [Chthoniobacteraceae bacterium]|nr:dihydrofolate reductase [Chthoniobacteraceae bacterium]